MLDLLKQVRQKVVIGFVGGSDLVKITEQLSLDGKPGTWQQIQCNTLRLRPFVLVLDKWDYAFAENGLTAYKLGKELPSQSFIKHVGESDYKKIVNFCLHYIADLDLPIKRYARLSEACATCG